MRVRVIAVGTRMPAWVTGACGEYLTRLSAQLPVSLEEVAPAARSASTTAATAMATEAERLMTALRAGEFVSALDEHGTQLSTRELATWLGQRMQEGLDLALLIGGPDGLAPEVLARSRFTLALSRLTLPHALARVLLIEQLYR